MTSSKQNNFYQTILEDASDKAASLGLLTRSPNQQEINNPKIANIAGLTLKPSPLPEKAYKLAIKNEPIWHKLYTNIVSNKFKNEIPKLLSDVQEDFIEKLLISREKIEKNKFNQIGRLQFYRNDYMVDKDGGLKQIELNTSDKTGYYTSENIPMKRGNPQGQIGADLVFLVQQLVLREIEDVFRTLYVDDINDSMSGKTELETVMRAISNEISLKEQVVQFHDYHDNCTNYSYLRIKIGAQI